MIFDVEGDSLTPSKIHVLSYFDEDLEKIISLTNYDDMREWITSRSYLIGHNIIRFDIPVLERLLNVEIKSKLVDTLALSWYLWDEKEKHGLEEWGEEFGIPKVKIDDWVNLPIEDYIERCEEDVKITQRLWLLIVDYLTILYSNTNNICWDNTSSVISLPIISYLSFKMDCAREQERSEWKIDKRVCLENLDKLEVIKLEKEELVSKIMPKVAKYVPRDPPKKPYKKDGTLSTTGVNWFANLAKLGLTKDHKERIMIFDKWEEPNPNSPQQIKDWLFSLGWEPQTFKYVRDKDTGKTRAIPQIKKMFEPEFCDSVVALYEKEPGLVDLENLSIISARINNIKGFLECEIGGYVKAEIAGLTNTLRFKHKKPCVNLPGWDKLYGKEVRECLIARDGYELVGSDMTALEDLTKRHYMYPFDPEFVEAMSDPDYDPHLDLALHAGVLTSEEISQYKKGEGNLKAVKKIRQDYKKTNYSGTYGIGADKLSRELKCSKPQAAKLLEDFWKRNWAIKKVAESQKVISIKGQKWIFNPVSEFFYSLREEKDRFSTLNQSTGVYCFDKWIANFRSKRPQLTAQFHDEVVLEIKEGSFDKCSALLQEAIDKVNDQVKLNVTLSIDIKHGRSYYDVH